jgi:sphingomyelin phosphodiesterase acid-like 3
MFRNRRKNAAWLFAVPAAFAALAIFALPALAQRAAAPSQTVDALLVSDIHFEPFRDPGKVPQLAAAPVSEWRTILDAPPSVDREQRFAALEKTCHTRGLDTDQALFVSSLKAIRHDARGVRFVAVAGDLLAHAFDCKFDATVARTSDAAYRSFTVKTMEYVLRELRAALPGVPVYPALGNNDSGCGDYRLDPRSEFLAESARSFTADVPAASRPAAEKDFAAEGDYSVVLPAPFRNARLLAIDDLFESRRYTGCAGKSDPAPATEQIAWLRDQLDAARAAGEKVWIVGHIPPGIDPYSTATHLRNVCSGQAPEMFLNSTLLPDAIAAYGDVVSLAVFAHTHMDEMRLLTPATGGHGPVAIKMTPSISPINGNRPSFTIASIDAATATLKDYRIIASADELGSSWKEEYDYAQAYGMPDFSSASAAALIAGFHADPSASTAASQTYIRNYYVRDASLAITVFWPQYACSLGNYTSEAYRACLCPDAH